MAAAVVVGVLLSAGVSAVLMCDIIVFAVLGNFFYMQLKRLQKQGI